MSDTLPTIDADQLTKSVSLAAAGTLSAVEAETEREHVDEWQNGDNTFEIAKAEKRNSSLKCLESLSTSVSSGLGKLNHLNLDKPYFVYSPRNIKSNLKNNAKNDTSPSSVVRKYSSRKNYKLMPPLIPSQVRTNLTKPGPKVVHQRQLVTLSHCSNVHNPQEMKSVPVRPARYTTNYLFVRTAQIVPSMSGEGTAEMTFCTASASPGETITPPPPSVSSLCAANGSTSVTESAVVSAASAVKFPVGTPILFPFPQVEQASQSIPSMSVTLTPPSDMRQPARHASSTKLQPLFRLPFPVNSIHSNVILKTVPVSKEGGTFKIKENACVDNSNNQLLFNTNVGDTETAVCHTNGVLSQHVLPSGGSPKHAVSTVNHILVPVSTPTCELALLTSFASPVVVTAKLARSSTLTVNSRPSQPHGQTIVTPQAGLVTSDPSCTPSSSSSNIIASSGQILISNPSFQLVTGKSSVQTLGTSRLRSPIVFTHIASPRHKEHDVTQASVVRFTGSQLSCTQSLSHKKIPISRTHLSAYQKPNSCGIITVSDVVAAGEHGTHLSLNMQRVPLTTPLDIGCVASGTTLTPESTTQSLHLAKPLHLTKFLSLTKPLHLTKALPESIHTSPIISKPGTETAESIQKVDQGDVHKFSYFSRTMLPSPGVVAPVSLQSTNSTNLQEKHIATSISSVISSNSPGTSQTMTNSTPGIQSKTSASTIYKTSSTATVSQAPFQMSTSTTGSQQLSVHGLSLPATTSVHHLPLTVLAVAPRPHQLQRLSLPGAAQNNLQPNQLSVAGIQKADVKSEPGAGGMWPSTKSCVSEADDGIAHFLAFAAQVSNQKPHTAFLPPTPSPKPLSSLPSTLSDETDASVPLSKEVAAAAMVSLSALSDFSESSVNLGKTSAQNYTSPGSQILSLSSSVTSTQSPPQFLIPSSDRSKLVISSAGIEHLQSLLRKQGISEGYFIITSPRIPPLLADMKPSSETNAGTSFATSTSNNKNDNLTRMATQKPVSSLPVCPENFLGKSTSASSFVRSFVSEHVNSNATREEGIASNDQMLERKEEGLELVTDESDNENSSSSYSRSSSTALVIETGEEDEQMDVDRQCSNSSSKEDDDVAREDVMSSESNGIEKPASNESITDDHSSPKLAHDTTWETESIRSDDARQSIPQSPLSLSDLVRQQQSRPGFSRHLEYSFLTSPENKMKEVLRKSDSESPRLPSSESHDFQFPMPVCPASSFGTSSQHNQHTGSDMQASFQHNIFASNPSFSTELSFESNVHQPVLESRMGHNLEDVSNASPKLMPNAVNVSSPKSPLSVSSSQTLDQNTPLNPPMTPNTMLINLLNRVPTPFLTNSQDLLSVPTSQENVVNESDSAGDFEMAENKTREGLYSGKNLDFTSGHTVTQLDAAQVAGQTLMYSESSRSLSSGTGSYVAAQNALELIASNYAPSCTRNNVLSHDINSSRLSSNFTMVGSKPFDHSSYTHCNMANEVQSISFSENFQQESGNRDICNSFHCKSCSGPLLVTVNLDPESPKYVVTLPNREEKAPESLLGTYEHASVFGQTLNLQEHDCNGEVSVDSSRMAPEKSRETDILRHLILNTSSSSLHTLQPVQNLRSQQYNIPTSTFNISQNHHSQDSQFECRVESFLEPDNQHKTLSGGDINQSSTFSSQDESFLHINHVHTQPSPSYDSSNTSFQASAHQSYENTVSSSFDNRNAPSLGNQANTSYIMQTNMSSDTPFSVQDMTKSNMPMSHDFMESDNRLQHLAPFRSEDHQSELFYQHADQTDMHQHHYDPTSQHQGLEYHLDNLPPSHQSHQYSSTSLAHPGASRMFSDHAGNVEYMNSQYQPQYYDSDGVASSLPLFPQQCVVGSEAPVIGNTAEHPCSIPFNSAPRGLQLEFRFPPDDDDGNNIEKQPVLPSASFSPPSVADQAATPDPAGMSMYHGSFPNLSMYDMYMRGGSGDARGVAADTVPESGNFCVECNVMYKVQCKFHPCDYVYVSDTPILSHARLTLPSCLRLGTSSVTGHTNNTDAVINYLIPNKGLWNALKKSSKNVRMKYGQIYMEFNMWPLFRNYLGVYAKDKIAARTKFGPLIGSPVSCDKLSSTRSFSLWQTFLGTSVKVMDTSDENSSNWLMFLKPARVSLEQNLAAFQHGNSVYFVTRADIEPEQELLYWFAKDYSQMLGITSKSKSAQHQLCPHCPVCKHVFPDRKQVHSHVRLQHPKPCTKKCSHCSRRFSQVSHLNTHITSVHLRVKKFICSHCGKRFSDSSNFRKHVKSHSDERLFKCPICGKAFRQKAHLKLHMNTHMPVKNEQCGFCGERFTRAFTRRQHELQHTKQNKIQCVHCDKVFYKQQVYKQHLKIHSNERRYVCSHCSKAFRTKANLTRHGPTCKQQKCVVIPPPPSSLPASQIQAGDFLHSSHSEVSLSVYSNDASTHSESV